MSLFKATKWQGIRKKTSIGNRWIKTSSMNKSNENTANPQERMMIHWEGLESSGKVGILGK